MNLHTLSIDQVTPDPNQPRKTFDEVALRELADSIDANGLIQPIVVRRDGTRFIVVAGERRYRAHCLLGRDCIQAVITDQSMVNIATVQVIENLQRQDLSPLELANSYRSLIEATGWSQQELAAQVGKSKAHVSKALALLDAAPEVIQLVDAGRLTAAHADELKRLGNDRAAEVAQLVAASGMTRKQLREKIDAEVGAAPAAPSFAAKPAGPQGREALAVSAVKAVLAMPDRRRDPLLVAELKRLVAEL